MFEETKYENGKWYINRSMCEKNWKLMTKGQLSRMLKDAKDKIVELRNSPAFSNIIQPLPNIANKYFDWLEQYWRFKELIESKNDNSEYCEYLVVKKIFIEKLNKMLGQC